MFGWDHSESLACSCEISFMRINTSIWFPHGWFLEVTKSLKGIYFCLEVWWRQSSRQPHGWKLSERDSSMPTALSPKGGPCMCGVSVFIRLMCLFVVKTVLASFWGLRNWKMIYNARPSENEMWENSRGPLTQETQLLDRINVCSILAVGQQLCQSFKLIFLPTLLLIPLNHGEKQGAFDPREISQPGTTWPLSGFLFSMKGCGWRGHIPEWLKKKKIYFSYKRW